ncbi:MAG: prepilin peptidase [Terracidiphilus sp.]
MIRIFGTIFAGLLGLAFGSFLNVCLTRWPQGESIVHPRSHCRNCDHTLSGWENIPLVSWLALRGRCRNCKTPISWRYPLVELAVGALWAHEVWIFLAPALDPNVPSISPFLHYNVYNSLGAAVGKMIFLWLLIALAALDAEQLWLPDFLTLTGIALGVVGSAIHRAVGDRYSDAPSPSAIREGVETAIVSAFAILAAALLILIIRWLYKLIRHREGIGLGDVKLMALLAAWLGISGALLSFAIGVVLGALVAVVLLIAPRKESDSSEWSLRKLPLGTFLCIGGIISALSGQPIIAAYLHWAGF